MRASTVLPGWIIHRNQGARRRPDPIFSEPDNAAALDLNTF
jgi:hypothetical protein